MNFPDPCRNNRILVVDDNRDIHGDFQKILGSASDPADDFRRLRASIFQKPLATAETGGFQLTSACQGQEAADLTRKAMAAGQPFALAFVDMRMPPGWDGLQTIQELWKLDPKLQIVVCTAYSDHPWGQIESLPNASDRLLVLKKPFDPVEVRRLAVTLAAKWSLARRAELKMSELEHVVAERTAELTQARQKDQLKLEELQTTIRTRTAALRRAASHDDLTGLPNRTLFHDRLARALEFARRAPDQKIAVFFLDVDRFKLINDSFGHSAGDALLRVVADRLRGVIRSTDSICHGEEDLDDAPVGSTAARLGGDEFCLLLTGLQNADQACAIAHRILRTLDAPITLSGRELRCNASIGIALSENGREKADEMVRNADTAMYRAKSLGASGGSHYFLFDEATGTAPCDHPALESDLRAALAQGQFRAHFQPVVSLSTGQIRGAETLLRWEHPQRGLLRPSSFIELAEHTGIVHDLGQWVLSEACARLALWRARYAAASELSLGVNISASQVEHPEFARQVRSTIEQAGLSAGGLILEMTEAALMGASERALASLADLRNAGVQVYLDKFGTMHSSLAVLHQFYIDGIKIDRSFVRGSFGNRRVAAIMHAIMSLAHDLNINVVAEGVESIEQTAMLQALGCPRGQGYLFSPPLPAAQVAALLSDGPRAWNAQRISA